MILGDFWCSNGGAFQVTCEKEQIVRRDLFSFLFLFPVFSLQYQIMYDNAGACSELCMGTFAIWVRIGIYRKGAFPRMIIMMFIFIAWYLLVLCLRLPPNLSFHYCTKLA